jgi:two-component system response regulator HupR/HoxA
MSDILEDLPTILVIDDEPRSVEALERILEEDFEVRTATSIAEAEAILESDHIHILLCDQCMPDMTGVEFLKSARERWPDIVRMIISGYTDAEDIIRGVNEAGIYQYVTKPWQPESLLLTLKNAAKLFELQRSNELLAIELKMSANRAESVMETRRRDLKDNYNYDDGIIRAETSSMNEICDRLAQLAPYDVFVLISGESGTGKELAARSLHYNSLRWNKPFVVENCGALPDELLESELFGHKRGAFTGAVQDHIGLFERADGGTIFLDEIGEVSPAFQVKLLRVLQEGEIRPVGSSKTRQIDVRVIAATNKDLEIEMRAGRFRQDLYYRLAGVTITLPALRDRRDDVEPISQILFERAQKSLKKNVGDMDSETIACLKRYHWPGNVRELMNEIQHMVVMAEEGAPLTADLLSPRILRAAPPDDDGVLETFASLDGTLKDRIEALEARIIHETLIRHRWNKSKAARELGLSRVGLRSKLERYSLDKIESLDEPSEKVKRKV